MYFNGFSQFVEKGSFKIFRGKVAGADINFRIEPDNTYELYVVNFWCSLCDFDSMNRNINQKGKWAISNDSIQLLPQDTNAVWYFKKLDDSNLKPLFHVNREFYNINNDSLTNKMLANNISSDLFDFKLLYETYNNGVVKKAKYESNDNKTDYLILFDKSGEVQKIEKMKKQKRK
jgi:hypothetical protein